MAIEVQQDAGARRVVILPGEGARGERMAQAIIGVVRANPEAADWDWIIDLRDGLDRYLPEHTDTIRQAFAGARATGTRTVLVSTSPAMHLLAKTLDFTFPGRTHMQARTPEAAHALLDAAPR